jgi:polysaccharide pyruvyl transferase WcaK-like protein
VKIDILVVGAYGNENFGDDLLLACLCRVLNDKLPTKTIMFQVSGSYCASLIPGIKTVAARDSSFLNPQILIYGGGTQFASFDKERHSKLVGIIRRVKNYIADPSLLYANITRRIFFNRIFSTKRVNMAIGIGIGPFKGFADEEKAKKTFLEMDLVAVRDELSYSYCEKWRLPCFSLKSDIAYLFQENGVLGSFGSRPRKRVGIIVRDWPFINNETNYMDRLLPVAEELIADGYDFSFISFSRKSDRNCKTIIDGAGFGQIEWDPYTDTIEKFIDMLGGFDVLVTARYHGAVAASLLEIPFICIGIEPKLVMIGGLFDAPVWESPFQPEALMRILENVIEKGREITVSISLRKERERVKAQEMIDSFASRCLSVLEAV